MTHDKDGGPADFITDELAATICATIATGYGKGGFPIDPETQELVGWHTWLRKKIAEALLAEREKANGGEG